MSAGASHTGVQPYRKHVYHVENGVWMYRCGCTESIKEDFARAFAKSIYIDAQQANPSLPRQVLRSTLKVFSPLL